MPRVVPSQVVHFIAAILSTSQGPSEFVRMNSIGSARLSAVLDLVDQVPAELLTMDHESYASFTLAKADAQDMVSVWDSNRKAGQPLVTINLHPSRNPLVLIRDILAKCPDESPAPSTSELKFITDTDLRENLRSDIGVIDRALSNGEWKAATVLAGSAIEAILLWDITNRRAATYPAAVAALVGNGTFRQKPPNNPEEWVLQNYIEVAAHLGIIKPDTVIEARLAKDFRNLIHPGRAQRLGQTCDRGTALSCVAALEHVVRDLT
jgi:hypothetical protein